MRTKARTSRRGAASSTVGPSRVVGQRALTPWLYILPALILIVGVIYVGIGYTGWASTLDWNGISDDQSSVGIDNYVRLAADPVFWSSLQHVAIYAVISIPIGMAIGLVVAILLSSRSVLGKGIYKIIFFVPVILAPTIVATTFRVMLTPDGQFNDIL